MEPSRLRPKSAKHNYKNRLPRPKSVRSGDLETVPKPQNFEIPSPTKLTDKEPDCSRIDSPFRPKSAHPRSKSRRGLVVDIFNSQNSTYTDITVIKDSQKTSERTTIPKQGKKKGGPKKKPNGKQNGVFPVSVMATDNMKENKTMGNVKVVAHQVTHQAETITHCYYRPLTPIIINEDEYYANLDPVEYFNDPTVCDLPMCKEKPKPVDKPPVRSPELNKVPREKNTSKIPEKPRPFSEGIKEQNKTIAPRKKFVNTKNSVYAMFFEDRDGVIGLDRDSKRHLRPVTDEKVIDHNSKGLRYGAVVGNRFGLKPASETPKVDPNKGLQGNRIYNTRGPPGSEKSWIPRYTGLYHYNSKAVNPENRNVNIAQVHAFKDPKAKYKYELRPFSEGVNIMAENEMLRFRATQEVYASKYNVDKLLAKHKKKCGNFPSGFDLKPRRNNFVGSEQVQLKNTGAINGRVTPRPRKLKPIQGVHKT